MKRTVKREFRDYQDKLIQDLQNPELASAYLKARNNFVILNVPLRVIHQELHSGTFF